MKGFDTHLFPDRENQLCFLGDGNELQRRHKPILFCMQACQRLKAENRVVVEIDNRLILQKQVIVARIAACDRIERLCNIPFPINKTLQLIIVKADFEVPSTENPSAIAASQSR